jgi:hypothetical protein
MSTSLCRASGVLTVPVPVVTTGTGIRAPHSSPIVPRNNVGGSSVVAQEFEPWEGSGPGLFGRHAGKGPSWLAGAARCRCKLIPAPRMPLPRIFPGFHPWVGCLDVMFGSSATAPSSDRTHTQTSMRHTSAGMGMQIRMRRRHHAVLAVNRARARSDLGKPLAPPGTSWPPRGEKTGGQTLVGPGHDAQRLQWGP